MYNMGYIISAFDWVVKEAVRSGRKNRMKKPTVNILVLVTCIFAAFTMGFAMGRSLNRTPVRVWQATIAPTSEVLEIDTTPTDPVIVNINTATSEQLQTLPGIGPVLAERIIAWREENGSFRAPEELTKVKGIGDANLLEILDLITVGAEE